MAKKPLTLKMLEKRVARLERIVKEIAPKADHAYIHTMRIGGGPR